MAANTTGMRVEGTTISGTEHRGKWSLTPRAGAYGLVAALIVALMIGGAALHSRGGSHSSAVAIPRAATGAQARFLENNTTNLPNLVTTDIRPVITSAQEKFLDVNMTWMPVASTDNALRPDSTECPMWRECPALAPQLSGPYMEGATPILGQRR